MMDVKVKYFATIRDIVGSGENTLQLPAGTTVGSLVRILSDRYAGVRPWAPYLRVAINRTYADVGTEIRPGDEVAVIPPVSGG
jgi:molybdopterin converting factor subunit 1